jgi:hypothetical protein
MELSVSDKVVRHIREMAAKMGATLEVGFLEGATYPDGTPVAAVAFWNEFGNGSAPPRPFFRTMIANESPGWAEKIAAIAGSRDADLNFNGSKILTLMGEDIQGALIRSINDFTTPALAESTIKRKGNSKPLIETSHMVNSTGYRVIK